MASLALLRHVVKTRNRNSYHTVPEDTWANSDAPVCTPIAVVALDSCVDGMEFVAANVVGIIVVGSAVSGEEASVELSAVVAAVGGVIAVVAAADVDSRVDVAACVVVRNGVVDGTDPSVHRIKGNVVVVVAGGK
jgi:hypothetical protein